MNRKVIILGLLVAVACLLASCGTGCRGGSEILDFFNIAPTDIDKFRSVLIEVEDVSITLEKPAEIRDFATKLYDGYTDYLETTPSEERNTERKEVGKIVVQKGDVKSCYKLFQSEVSEDIFAIRVNDSSKGGGSIFWFRRFEVENQKVF